MRIGVTCFLTDQSIGPAQLAREAEDRGFSSLWVPEHTHIPASRRTPWPIGNGELPEEYRRILDPMVTLATAAATTTALRVGTGISLVAQHDPIALAKAVATLDLVSGGRVSFGVGFGWNREELADHGVDFATRRDHVRECVLAMQSLWRDEVAAFKGTYISYEPSWAWPKPVQRPWPPVLLGGAPGPKVFAHAAEWADGWMPIGGRGLTEAIPRLREAWMEAGRDGEPIVVPFGTQPSPGKLEHFRDLGIDEVILQLPSGPADEVLPVLDEHAQWVGA